MTEERIVAVKKMVRVAAFVLRMESGDLTYLPARHLEVLVGPAVASGLILMAERSPGNWQAVEPAVRVPPGKVRRRRLA